MNIKPVNGYLVIEPYEQPTQVGDLEMVQGDKTNSAPVRGTVIATSSKNFAVGAELFFRKYAIDELKFTDEEGKEKTVYVLDEREILAELISDKTNENATKETKNRIADKELSKGGSIEEDKEG